jgi:Tfp pilus assembly protein PilF
VICIILIFSGLSWGQDLERTPSDYFSHSPNSEQIRWAEKYHLNRQKFFARLKEGQYKYALDELHIVLDYLPNHPKALFLLQVTAPLAKKPRDVIYRYERAIHLYPQHAITHAQFGLYLAGNQQVEKGIVYLKKAISLDPKNEKFQTWLANAYEKAGKKDLTKQADKKAKDLRPPLPDGG